MASTTVLSVGALAGGNALEHAWVQLAVAVFGLTSATGLTLAFTPPAAYGRWVEARWAARAPQGTA